MSLRSDRPSVQISGIQTFSYENPLVTPLDLGGGYSIRRRKGVLVRVALSDGGEDGHGWGDVAPLPGFSRETLDDAQRSAQQCAQRLKGVEVPIEDDPVSTLWDVADSFTEPLPPSVRFGLEQALASSMAALRNTTLSTLLSVPASHVQRNALLTGTIDEMRRHAEKIDVGPGGYRTVKMKVGRGDLQAEARLVQELHNRWGETVSLRLDANRAWSIDEATRFAQEIEGVPLEYIEEPLQHPRALSRFVHDTGMPVALDETTRELPVDRWLDEHYASAFVIKPMLIGFRATLDVHRRLASMGTDADRPSLVISSAYESGVGLAGLAVLAAAVHRPGAAAGLDTYRALKRDVLAERLPMTGSSVNVEEWMRMVTDAHVPRSRLGSPPDDSPPDDSPPRRFEPGARS